MFDGGTLNPYAPTMPKAISPPPPRPLAPWQTAQLTENCCSPRLISDSQPPAFWMASGGTWLTKYPSPASLPSFQSGLLNTSVPSGPFDLASELATPK